MLLLRETSPGGIVMYTNEKDLIVGLVLNSLGNHLSLQSD